ncbi:MAG: DUF3445 domain-containing protein [Pirellulales bacterium]
MPRALPFSADFDQRIGVSPLPLERTVVFRDARYADEIRLKRELLAEDHSYYFRDIPASMVAQWEALDFVLDAAVRSPAFYKRDDRQRVWSNPSRDEERRFLFGDEASLPYAPLDFAGRHVQEDLLLLDPTSKLVAGQLCFANGWSLEEKLGRTFLAAHEPLPGEFASLLRTADRFLERMPPGRSFTRTNWAIRVTDRLDLSMRWNAWYRDRLADVGARLNASNAGELLYLRIEDQTLTRLPRTAHILFTIRTTSRTLDDALADPTDADVFLSHLRQTPTSVLDYKLISPVIPALMDYLVNRVETARHSKKIA